MSQIFGDGEFLWHLRHARESTREVDFNALLLSFGEQNFFCLNEAVVRTKQCDRKYVNGLEEQWHVNYGKIQAHLGVKEFNKLMNNLQFNCEMQVVL